MINGSLKSSPFSAEDLANLTTFNVADATVNIGNVSISQANTLPMKELTHRLYALLHAGDGALAQPELSILRADQEDLLSADLHDDMLVIPRIQWSDSDEEYARVGDVRILCERGDYKMRIPRLRPRLTPGFVYYMGGSADRQKMMQPSGENISRIYIASSDPRYSLCVWEKLIHLVKEERLDLSLKALNDSASFPRSDAIVVYVSTDVEQNIRRVVDVVKAVEGSQHMAQYVSLFTRRIWANVAVSDQPRDAMKRKMSFGEDRCEAIAEAIRDYFLTGVNFLSLLKVRLKAHGIDSYDFSKTIFQ